MGRVPATFGAFSRNTYGTDNLLIGTPLAYQYLTSLRPDSLPDDAKTERANLQRAKAFADACAKKYAEVLPFIDDIAARYAAADVVICRAGAITVSELCAAGVPAILVPFVVRTTQHQRSNAEWLAQHGAAVHLPQEELTAPRIAELLRSLTRERLLEMAVNARALGRPNAMTVVADAIEHIARANGPLTTVDRR